MSFCLPFAYYKEWQEAQQQEKQDLETPLLGEAQVCRGYDLECRGWELSSGHFVRRRHIHSHTASPC
jgi:hypothetical protein